MAYATRADLLSQISEAELIALTDDAGTGLADEAIIAKALEDAASKMDSYLGSRHRVPMSPVPAALPQVAVDIAVYLLSKRRGSEPSKTTAKNYDDAILYLKDVARGLISLGAQDPEGTPQPAEAPELHPDNPPRLFNRKTMGGF